MKLHRSLNVQDRGGLSLENDQVRRADRGIASHIDDKVCNAITIDVALQLAIGIAELPCDIGKRTTSDESEINASASEINTVARRVSRMTGQKACVQNNDVMELMLDPDQKESRTANFGTIKRRQIYGFMR